MFTNYREYLNADLAVDYWSDEGISIAGELLGKFGADDWEALSGIWRGQNAQWKLRCAETLDSKLTEEGFSILLSMASGNDKELAMIALESLRSFPDSLEVKRIREMWRP